MKTILILFSLIVFGQQPSRKMTDGDFYRRIEFRQDFKRHTYFVERKGKKILFTGAENKKSHRLEHGDWRILEERLAAAMVNIPKDESCEHGILAIFDRSGPPLAVGCAELMEAGTDGMSQLASALYLASLIYRD